MQLFERVAGFLRSRGALARDASGAPADAELQAATAILLLEAGYGDTEYDWHEHRAIVRALEHDFGLGRGQVAELLDRASEIRPPVVTLADVTDVLRSRLAPEQRKEVVRLLWRVIRADGAVEPWEEAFADHVARAVGLAADEVRAARADA
ncbi:MAG TPA: TerB family tellurite resistance protein [Myxococcota bacterium]|jgi:uncharacterized tellurite resistance protein B-like protein|nr:TerB family tellurite resistance protein [Myxococcota bacterium]